MAPKNYTVAAMAKLPGFDDMVLDLFDYYPHLSMRELRRRAALQMFMKTIEEAGKK